MAVKDATGKYQYKLKQKAGDPVKQSVLRVTWPEEFTVVGLGTKRVVAEKMAAALACAKLKVTNAEKYLKKGAKVLLIFTITMNCWTYML